MLRLSIFWSTENDPFERYFLIIVLLLSTKTFNAFQFRISILCGPGRLGASKGLTEMHLRDTSDFCKSLRSYTAFGHSALFGTRQRCNIVFCKKMCTLGVTLDIDG